MKIVKATQDYNDLKLNRLVKKDEEIKVADDRAETLVSVGFATIIETVKEVTKKEVKKEKIVK